jgi:hypothetical protein
MPITIQPTGVGGVSIMQNFSNPPVHLDHWGVRTFCDDEALADRHRALQP